MNTLVNHMRAGKIAWSLLYSLSAIGVVLLAGYVRHATDAGPEAVQSGIVIPEESVAAPQAAGPPSQDWLTHDSRLQQPIDIALSDVTIGEAVTVLARKTGQNFAYAGPQSASHLSLYMKHVSAARVMQILADTSHSPWERRGNIYVLGTSRKILPVRVMAAPIPIPN